MKSRINPYDLASTYVRLRSDTSVEPLVVDETFWQRLSEGKLGTFRNEFLVSMHEFDSDWSMWEMHPNGDEIVCLIEGGVTFVLEADDQYIEVELQNSGSYIVVPKGAWHTARANVPSRMLFITAGEDTQHRDVSSVN